MEEEEYDTLAKIFLNSDTNSVNNNPAELRIDFPGGFELNSTERHYLRLDCVKYSNFLLNLNNQMSLYLDEKYNDTYIRESLKIVVFTYFLDGSPYKYSQMLIYFENSIYTLEDIISHVNKVLVEKGEPENLFYWHLNKATNKLEFYINQSESVIENIDSRYIQLKIEPELAYLLGVKSVDEGGIFLRYFSDGSPNPYTLYIAPNSFKLENLNNILNISCDLISTDGNNSKNKFTLYNGFFKTMSDENISLKNNQLFPLNSSFNSKITSLTIRLEDGNFNLYDLTKLLSTKNIIIELSIVV